MHRRSLLGAFSAALPLPALAQGGFPNRPVRVIVPYAAGGGSDVVARALAEAMAPALPGTIVVENRAGAGGTIGAEAVARAAPDGHALLLVDWPHAITATAYPSLPYRAREDFEPVGMVGRAQVMLFVRGDGPHRDMAGLLAAARARPGEVSFATSGNGTGTHLVAELLQRAANLRLNIVPYRGTGPAVTDLLAGHVDAMFTNTAGTTGHLRSGALRALCVLSPARLPEWPEIPTTAELGLPEVRGAHWFGLLAPARTPAPIVASLHAAAETALRSQAVSARLLSVGVTPEAMTPAGFGTMLEEEIARWGAVVRSAGISLS